MSRLAAASEAPLAACSFPTRAQVELRSLDGELVLRLDDDGAPGGAVALAPRGDLIAWARGATIALFELPGGREVRRLEAGGPVHGIHLGAERCLAVVGEGVLVAWARAGWDEAARHALGTEGAIQDVSFSGDGARVLVVDATRYGVYSGESWKRVNGLSHSGHARAALSADGRRALLADGAARKHWKLGGLATVKPLQTYGEAPPALAVAISPDGGRGRITCANDGPTDSSASREGWTITEGSPDVALYPETPGGYVISGRNFDALAITAAGTFLLAAGNEPFWACSHPDGRSWRAPEIDDAPPETTPLEGPADFETDDGLRAILASLGGLRPPASEEELAAAEATLGVTLPPLLRRLYRISNGLDHPDAVFFPLATPGGDGDAVLDQWNAYRALHDDAGHAEPGSIGVDAYPIGSVFGDADTYVLRTDQPGVFEHYPDDGCLEQRFDDAEGWLRSLVTSSEDD